MSAVETARDALFGNPPDPNKEPSREGMLAAITELFQAVIGAQSGITQATTAASLAPPAVGQPTTALVTNDGANTGWWLYSRGSWAYATTLNAAFKGAAGTMSAASNSDLTAGTDNTKSVTPAGLTFLGLTPALAISVSANALAAALNAANIGYIHDVAATTFALATTTNYTPGGLLEFAEALDAGTELTIGRNMPTAGAHLSALSTTAAKVNLVIYERPLTSANLNTAPIQSDDVVVGSASVSLAAAGLPAPTTATVSTTNGSANVSVVSGTLVAGQILTGAGFNTGALSIVTTGASAGGTAVINRPAVSTQTSVTTTVSTPADVAVALPAPPLIRSGYTYIRRWFVTDASGVEILIGTGFGAYPASAGQRKNGWVKNSGGWANITAGNGLGRSVTMGATAFSTAYDALILAQQLKAGLSSGGGIRRLCKGMGCEGIRFVDSFSQAFDNTTPKSFQMTLELAQGGDSFQFPAVNGNTAGTLTIDRAEVTTRPDMDTGHDNSNSLVWKPLTFNGGSPSVTIPAAPGQKRFSMVMSDVVDISTPTRTDSGHGGVVVVRCYISQAASIVIPWMEDIAAAAARTNGYAVSYRHSNGDCVTTNANFTAASEGGYSPFCGARYAARGLVVNFLTVGDSTIEAFADAIRSDGHAVRVARDNHNTAGVAWEAANLGWTGSETNQTWDHWNAYINAGLRGDIVLYAGGTPNDLGSASSSPQSFTAAMITNMRQKRAKAMQMMRSGLMVPIVTTWGPFTPAQYNTDASDALRVADNNDIKALAPHGVIVVDLASVRTSGTTDSDGQELPNTTNLADGVHENAAGYDAEKVLIDAAITTAIAAS